MNTINLIQIILFSILLSIYDFKSNYIDDFLDDYDIKYEENIKSFLKKYLINNDLFYNDRLIDPGEMRKIIIDVILEDAPFDELDQYTKSLYDKLANIFIEKYYKERNEIRGKDIYDLIDINEIIHKYYQLNGGNPTYDIDFDDTFLDDDDFDEPNKDINDDDYYFDDDL